MRRRVSLALGLLALSALAVGLFAGPASAKAHYTKAQKAHIRAQLRKAIKHNPKLIKKASFIKKAALVDFSLPVTIRIRQATDNLGGLTNNGTDNTATLDLGPSLGSRTIGLGGSLPATIKFHDAFDGGALGNVDLTLNQGGGGLTTTSVPLLTNHDVTSVSAAGAGCAGYPYLNPTDVDNYANLNGVAGAENNPGVDNLGNGPFGPEPLATAGDTVLRTGSLNLTIDAPGTTVTAASMGLADGTVPTQIVGASGGQANLFGNIPGKQTQVDVTANLTTAINSILREVDGATPPAAGGNNAANFNCRQAWTGAVTNHLGGIHLNGTLKISPAITADGKLRIAKTVLQSPAGDAAHVAVAACLAPYEAYAQEVGPPNLINPTVANSAPGAACNTTPPGLLNGFLHFAGIPNTLPTSNNGSEVAVQGALSVNSLTAEVLIGQYP